MKFISALSFLALFAVALPARSSDDEFPGGTIRVNQDGKPVRNNDGDIEVVPRNGVSVRLNGDGTGRRVRVDADGIEHVGPLAQIVTIPTFDKRAPKSGLSAVKKVGP